MNSYRNHYRKARKHKTIRQLARNERLYKNSFYAIEIIFIIIAVPILVVAFTSIPILIYFTITQNFKLWPFIILGILITLFQIMAIQYFIRRYFLKPYNLTFGEYLRMRFDERYRNKDNEIKIGQKTWYENLDEFIIRIKTEQREKTMQIYAQNHPHFQILQNNCH